MKQREHYCNKHCGEQRLYSFGNQLFHLYFITQKKHRMF